MKDIKEEERFIHRNEAKTIIDALFDNKVFRDDLTRDDLNNLEEWIDSTMNTRLRARYTLDRIREDIENQKKK